MVGPFHPAVAYEEYQEPMASRLLGAGGRYKALVLPTGSGKTRIALRFAQARLDGGRSVAYLVESDLHVKQVQDEAAALGMDVRFIPGLRKVDGDAQKKTQRSDDLQDYGHGLFVGLFTYAGYFHGSNVPRAEVLVVDDAHALQAEEFSYASVSLTEERFGEATLARLRQAIAEAVPSMRRGFEDLVDPVQRGGAAILVPPLPPGAKATLRDLVKEAAAGKGFHSFLLRSRVEACPHYLDWPLVVTKDTLVWQPFVVPFEALGQPISGASQVKELLLVTATAGPDRFLQSRLGLDAPVEVVTDPGVKAMGTRAILPYPTVGRGPAGLAEAAALVENLAKRFGAVVVTTNSGAKADAINQLMMQGMNSLSSKSAEEEDPIQRFRNMPEPKVLYLVNRPSGINIPSSVCRVAVHLDLPYANDGHGALAGAGADCGRALHASLAVRFSQLAGRLNRSETDRSIHLVLGSELPLEKGGLFIRTLEPAVLRDVLAGQRFAREWRHPSIALENGVFQAFLAGDDAPMAAARQGVAFLAPRLLRLEAQDYAADTSAAIEASRDLALGNWQRAFAGFKRLAQDARNQAQGNSQAFMALQALCAMHASAVPGPELYPPEGRKTLLKEAASAFVTEPALIAALDAATHVNDEARSPEAIRVKIRYSATIQYRRLASQGLGVPEGEDVLSEDAWTHYWREALTQHDHDTLQDHLGRALQLLGGETPRHGKGDNDIVVSWQGAAKGQGIAIEVKGRNAPGGPQESGVQKQNIDQARENAYEMRDRADVALLFTSKSKCDKGLREHAREGGIRLMLHADATEFASVLARHCVALARIERHLLGLADLHYLIDDFHDALLQAPAGEAPGFSRLVVA